MPLFTRVEVLHQPDSIATLSPLLFMTTGNKEGNNLPVIRIGIFIVSLLLICFTIIAYLNHKATSDALKNTPSVSVHPATPADYPYYLQLYPDLEIDEPPVNLNNWTKHIMPHSYIITHDGVPVGYIRTQVYKEVYYLAYLVVAKEHRRKGIGTAALKLLKKVAREKGFKKWGLHCDVNHTIPYMMYIKAGLRLNGDFFHLKTQSQTIKSLVADPKDHSTIVVHDPSKWDEMERDYKIIPGTIVLWIKEGRLPIVMLDTGGRIKGFTVFNPTSGTIRDLYLENHDDLTTFLSMLQTYRKSEDPNDNDGWTHFWLSNGGSKQMSDIIMQTLSGTVMCEKYDYLEGSTSE